VSKSKKINCRKVVKKVVKKGGRAKSGSKAFGDYFVVSRRQEIRVRAQFPWSPDGVAMDATVDKSFEIKIHSGGRPSLLQ
jgi:hypothetical protein